MCVARASYPPPGWIQLLERMLQSMSEIPEFDMERVLQIKAKFGDLRVYWADDQSVSKEVREKVETLIGVATKEASETCSLCGADQASIDHEDWGAIKCEQCAKCK
jgi:hypothetical protein